MSGNDIEQSPVQMAYKALGLGVGLLFGGILGLIAGNMIVFTGGGMVLGLALGSAMDKRKKGPNS